MNIEESISNLISDIASALDHYNKSQDPIVVAKQVVSKNIKIHTVSTQIYYQSNDKHIQTVLDTDFNHLVDNLKMTDVFQVKRVKGYKENVDLLTTSLVSLT